MLGFGQRRPCLLPDEAIGVEPATVLEPPDRIGGVGIESVAARTAETGTIEAVGQIENRRPGIADAER
jgi:hypothetical protein